MSKYSLCGFGVCMTITGVVLALRQDRLALAFFAVAALCFVVCRFSRLPKGSERDWFMVCVILTLIPAGFFLVSVTDTDDNLFWIGASFLLGIPVLHVFAGMVRDSAKEARKEKEQAQDKPELQPAEKHAEPVAEAREAVPEAVSEPAEADKEAVPLKISEPEKTVKGAMPEKAPEPMGVLKEKEPEKTPKPADAGIRGAKKPGTGGTSMPEYQRKATELIARRFEELGLKFDVKRVGNFEALEAGFATRNGPNIMVLFISGDDKNAVHVTFSVVKNISKDKRGRMLEACNLMNREVRYFNFYLQGDAVVGDYDFLSSTPDDTLGEMAGELFVRLGKLMGEQYGVFMKALYTDEEIQLQPHGEKASIQPAPQPPIPTEMLMTSQFPALYMKEELPTYRELYRSKLLSIGFSPNDAEKLFLFEAEIIRRHKKQYLEDVHFTASWYFSMLQPFFTDYPKEKADFLKEKYFTISELCKLLDEAEWHYWNSRSENLPDGVWDEICAWRLDGPGLEFAVAYIKMVVQQTGIPQESIEKLCKLQDKHLDKYKWKC